MEPVNFEKGLLSLARQRPFKPFLVELVSGDKFRIDHPEALVYRAGSAVFVGADGAPHFFDHESVSRLIASPRNGRSTR
jgi:hypothetical protein